MHVSVCSRLNTTLSGSGDDVATADGLSVGRAVGGRLGSSATMNIIVGSGVACDREEGDNVALVLLGAALGTREVGENVALVSLGTVPGTRDVGDKVAVSWSVGLLVSICGCGLVPIGQPSSTSTAMSFAVQIIFAYTSLDSDLASSYNMERSIPSLFKQHVAEETKMHVVQIVDRNPMSKGTRGRVALHPDRATSRSQYSSLSIS